VERLVLFSSTLQEHKLICKQGRQMGTTLLYRIVVDVMHVNACRCDGSIIFEFNMIHRFIRKTILSGYVLSAKHTCLNNQKNIVKIKNISLL